MEEELILKDTQDLNFLTNRISQAYAMYKDLLNPSVTWETSRAKESTINPEYVPRQTVFLKDPSIQKQYRDEIIDSISEVPSPNPLYLQCDLLLSEFLALKSKSKPEMVRLTLSKFYYTQVNYLQQFKYKFILNWTNNCQHFLISLHFVKEKLRKIDSELLECVESYERLRSADEVPLIPSKLDSSRTENNILPRDIEYYIKTGAEKLSLSRKLYCLISRIKWAWVASRTEIWKRSMCLLANLKHQSVERMKLLTGQDDIGEQKVVTSLITNVNLKNLKKQQEIKKRAKADHSVFAEEHKNYNEILLHSNLDEIDLPPQILTSADQLNGLLDLMCKEFKLVGDIKTDHGTTLLYQITHLLPDLFEVQRKRLEWKAYEASEKDLNSLRMSYIQSLKRGTTIKRYNTEINPSQLPGYKFVKAVSVKEPDWKHCKQLNPQIAHWQYRQKIRLNDFNKEDSLLKTSFDLLDVQDIATINRVIEEFSMNYSDRASKKGIIKSELGLSDEDIKKRYFSALLAENNSSTNQDPEERIEMPNGKIKGLYTLKLLKSRGLKQKLYEICNYFRSVERKLCLDINYLHKATESMFSQATQSSNPLLESLDGEATQYLPDKMPDLYGRQDLVEHLEGNIYIVDEAGEHIIYANVEEDVRGILQELLILGSFYINKYEVWSEDQGENFPVIDRDLLVNELLEEEVKFQEMKAKIITDYLEIYRHSVEPGEQLQICQKISDLMALRPRLCLQSSYFSQSYWAHVQALEQHSIFLRSVLGSYTELEAQEIYPFLYVISEVWDKVSRSIEEISVIHETENPIALSALEQAVWENACDIFRASISYVSPFSENILIDDHATAVDLLNLLAVDIENKEHMPKLIPAMFESKVRGTIQKDVPSKLQLLCNLVEVFRFRSFLEVHYEENVVLENVYRKQCISMKRENVELDFINFYPGNPHMSNLREWPGSKSNFKLPAFEITPILTENLNFKSSSCLKALILSQGLEEIKAVTEYQVTHKHLLIIACQINQYIVDRWERQIAEIEIAKQMKYVTKKSKVHWPNVLGRKGEGLVEEKAENEIKSIRARIYSSNSDTFVDIRKYKANYRENMKNNYNRILQKYTSVIGEKSPFSEIVSRNLICLLVNGYCREILREIYTQSIKIHIIKVSQEMKRLLRIVPPDLYLIHFSNEEIFGAEKSIVNIKAIPTTEYILALPGLQPQDSWKNWDPYFYAETPDVIMKKIKNLAFMPRVSETSVSNIVLIHEWPYTSQLKSMLQVMRAVLHIEQLDLFFKFLSIKGTCVMDLQDDANEGKNYWVKKESKENEEIHLKAVDGLLSQSSPVQGLYTKIKESLDFLNRFNEEIKEMSPEMQVPHIVNTAKSYLSKFAVIAFESMNKSLEDLNEKDATELMNFITPTFRLARKSLFVKPRNKYSGKDCPLISLCESQVFIDNSPKEAIGAAYIVELDFAFFSTSPSIRDFASQELKRLEHKLSEHLVNKQIKNNVNGLESINAYLDTFLQAWKLKSAYLMVDVGSALVFTPSVYEKVIKNYKNSLGLKAQVASKSIREDFYLANSVAESKILRENFNILLCRFTINFIQEECGRVLDTSRLMNNISLFNEFTCNADRNYNDITRRIGALHFYLNILRNRCTMVDAPTCGKAQVFLVRDMTKITKKFSDCIVKFLETEYRAREETFALQHEFFQKLKTQKEEEVTELNKTLKTLITNFDNMVNSQLSQKGNSLIYELDRSHRKLQEIKANMRLMPRQLKEIVYLEYKDDIEQNERKILDIKQNFQNFKLQLTQELKADISHHKTSAFTEIKSKTSKSKAKEINMLLTEDLNFTKKKQGLDLESLQNQVTKIRTFKIWAKLYKKNKFQKNIQELEEQLVSNQFLWEQLNESQRREALLKQELSYTQQSLASAEKLADKLQTSIEEMNNQRLRLQQYKSNKGKRLNELEIRVKQQEKIEHRDNQVLLNQFYVQNEKIQTLQIAEEKAALDYIPHHIRYQRDIHHLKKTLQREQTMKLSAFEELAKFRNQIKNINKDPETKIKDMKTEYQKLVTELKTIKDQNGIFKKRLTDIGDNEFISRYANKDLEIMKSIASRGSANSESLNKSSIN